MFLVFSSLNNRCRNRAYLKSLNRTVSDSINLPDCLLVYSLSASSATVLASIALAILVTDIFSQARSVCVPLF
jgi:hypothetical protein